VNVQARAGWLVWSGLIGQPEGLLLLAASANLFKLGKISHKNSLLIVISRILIKQVSAD